MPVSLALLVRSALAVPLCQTLPSPFALQAVFARLERHRRRHADQRQVSIFLFFFNILTVFDHLLQVYIVQPIPLPQTYVLLDSSVGILTVLQWHAPLVRIAWRSLKRRRYVRSTRTPISFSRPLLLLVFLVPFVTPVRWRYCLALRRRTESVRHVRMRHSTRRTPDRLAVRGSAISDTREPRAPVAFQATGAPVG